MRAALVCLALLAFSAAPARARDSAELAYAQGAFLEAADIAEATGGGDALALAARAALAEAITGHGGDIDALVARAEADARRALAAAPGSIDARMNLALALGLKGRRASIGEAMRGGYAREGRILLTQAVARAPDEAWAHALLGAWHLEVVRRGGAIGAAYYGANTGAGIAGFERARALAPDDAAIAYQYAVALLELEPERYSGKAAALLVNAGGCATGDAFEARVKAQAARVAAVLETQGAAAAVRVATVRLS